MDEGNLVLLQLLLDRVRSAVGWSAPLSVDLQQSPQDADGVPAGDTDA